MAQNVFPMLHTLTIVEPICGMLQNVHIKNFDTQCTHVNQQITKINQHQCKK